jgi:hypothetical protein
VREEATNFTETEIMCPGYDQKVWEADRDGGHWARCHCVTMRLPFGWPSDGARVESHIRAVRAIQGIAWGDNDGARVGGVSLDARAGNSAGRSKRARRARAGGRPAAGRFGCEAEYCFMQSGEIVKRGA